MRGGLVVEAELDVSEKSLQMLVSGVHLTVSAGLTRRLAADIQDLDPIN